MLEAWFQWEVISNVSSFETPYGLEITRIGRGMAMTMLFAHWLYLLGSVLHMLEGVCTREVDSDTEDEAEPNDRTNDEADEVGLRQKSLSMGKLKRMDTMQQFLASSTTVTPRSPGKRQSVGIKKAEQAASAVTHMAVHMANDIKHIASEATHLYRHPSLCTDATQN